MPKSKTVKPCIYCGTKMSGGGELCQPCREKLRLIRKIRAIVLQIKRQAEEKKENENKSNKLRIY